MSWLALRASSADFTILRQLNNADGSNGDDGGGSRLDGRRTNRTKVLRSSRNTDMVDNIHTDNSHIRSPGSHSHTRPGTQIRFRPTRQPPNAAPKQKRIHLPPMQLREVVSSSLFYLPMIQQWVRRKVSRFIQQPQPWDKP